MATGICPNGDHQSTWDPKAFCYRKPERPKVGEACEACGKVGVSTQTYASWPWCPCGCGRRVQQRTGGGRPRKWATANCRKEHHRQDKAKKAAARARREHEARRRREMALADWNAVGAHLLQRGEEHLQAWTEWVAEHRAERPPAGGREAVAWHPEHDCVSRTAAELGLSAERTAYGQHGCDCVVCGRPVVVWALPIASTSPDARSKAFIAGRLSGLTGRQDGGPAPKALQGLAEWRDGHQEGRELREELERRGMLGRAAADEDLDEDLVDEPEAGDLVAVTWPSSANGLNERLGRLERWNANGKPVVRLFRIDSRGRTVGELGSPRVISSHEMTTVLSDELLATQLDDEQEVAS